MIDSRHRLRFLLGDGIREVEGLDPTLTLLDYLRETERRIGTKEGCAEGDCGACTVLVGELVDGTVRYRAVNACILFLASLDGKQVLTVEDLRGTDGALHPVQQAMVESHGSQCGFCTPGIVMSLAGLREDGARPDREAIDNALAGNLCRCTGYDDVVTAARAALEDTRGGGLATPETRELLEAITPKTMLDFGTGQRRFLTPGNMDELLAVLGAHPGARILAGGTDLALGVTKRLEDPEILVSLDRVAGLEDVLTTDSEVTLGAAVSLAGAGEALGACFPDLRMLFRRFGSVQIRNAGTLGGNIANASPIGDTLPALLALDAEVTLCGPGGRRQIALADFFEGYRKTALAPGEILERIRVPRQAERELRVYKISKRRDQDISTLCGAFALERDGSRVKAVRVAFGGMAATPARASKCEAVLLGNEWTADTLELAVAALAEDFSPLSDVRGSARYRRVCAGNLLRKFFHETTTGEAVTVFTGEGDTV